MKLTTFLSCTLVASMAALVLNHSAVAQSDRSGALTIPANRPGSMAILLGVHLIQQELDLSSSQKSAVNSVRNSYRDAARKIVAETGNSPEAKQKGQLKLDALTTQYNQRALDILTPKQRQRAVEIEHQILGGYALLSAPLQRELNLSDDQKSRIHAIYEDSKAQVAKVNLKFQEGKISNQKRLLDLRADRLARQERMLKVLNPEQQARFEKLGGDTFEL